MARWTDLACSFCGKRQDESRRLIAGPGVFICSECVMLCNRIIADDAPRGQGPRAHRVTVRPWWRRGLAAAGRLLHRPPQRRPAWRGRAG
jgi:hypothetical protein